MPDQTLAPYIRAFLTERATLGAYGPKSLRSVPGRLTSLSKCHGARPLDKLTEKAIIRWLGSLSHLSKNSRASYMSSARQFTAWLAARGHIPKDPCVGIPPLPRSASVPRAQEPEAIAALLAACRDDRERAIVWLMVGLGLRRMEVAGLRWEHIDTRAGLLLVATAKNDRPRWLPLTPEVWAALRPLQGHASGAVISSHQTGCAGKPISPEHVGALMTQAMRRAGIKTRSYDGVSGHALRHTCASDTLDQCGDIRVVQEVLGHAHLSTTAIYLRRRTAAQMMDALSGRDYGTAPAEAA